MAADDNGGIEVMDIELHDNPETRSDTEEVAARQKTSSRAYREQMWAGQSSMFVAVRLRPLVPGHDRDTESSTVKQLDNKMVVVLDPKPGGVVGASRLRHPRNREKRYAFDHVFDPKDDQVRCLNRESVVVDSPLTLTTPLPLENGV